MNTLPTIGSFISAGWQTFKKHWKFIILAAIATLIVQILLQALQSGGRHMGIQIVTMIIVALIGIVITLGWARVLLALNRTDSATWDTFKTQPAVWLRYIKVTIWYILYFIMWVVASVIVPAILVIIALATQTTWLLIVGAVIGGIAFVVVSIYFAVRYWFIDFAVLDYPELRSREIFRRAGAMTQGHMWKLLGWAIVLGLFNLLGLICLVIGLIVTVPVTKLAQARIYDALRGKTSDTPEVIVTETVIVEEVIG